MQDPTKGTIEVGGYSRSDHAALRLSASAQWMVGNRRRRSLLKLSTAPLYDWLSIMVDAYSRRYRCFCFARVL